MQTVKWVTIAAAALSLQAQVPDDIRQATIRGSRGTSGKCTVEVRVDVAAEVDIYGDSGRLRTLGGQPAGWTRLECTDPLPYNMSDFRFRGIDGRGQVRLAQDPRNNRGIAIIRIDDPSSGSEAYTFDIEWSGASGGAPTGGFSTAAPRLETPAPGPGRRLGQSAPGRRGSRRISAEQAIDLCRTELRSRVARDYNLREIDITSAALDTTVAVDNRITGAFSERGGRFRRTPAYRFNCDVDYNTGQVSGIEILRGDGSVVPPGTALGGTPNNQPAYDQNRVLRACQDAVAARANRDGYQKLNFTSTAVDPNRAGTVSGTLTGSRGPVGDAFAFTCSMDFPSATVRNVELSRR
jgi:hypothetical protein